jgi:cobalt-zinc-cadmium resistance protein CzcA
VQIPLTDVANVHLTSGAAFIYRENQERYIPVKFSVRGRDLGPPCWKRRRRSPMRCCCPGGYHLEWVGEFGNLQEAIGRLAVVVPLAIVLICLLLYINFGSLTDMLLAASVIPMALIGGIFTLYFTGHAVQRVGGDRLRRAVRHLGDGWHHRAHLLQSGAGSGMDRTAAILRTCHVQFRPVMMTCIVAAVGSLHPAAVSNGIGSQVQKPLALVVVGGIMLAPVLILIVLPVLIDLFSPCQPSAIRIVRCRAASELPPNQSGIGLTGIGVMVMPSITAGM